MTLPASITLTQVGLSPSLDLDTSTSGPVPPAPWISNPSVIQTAFTVGDNANALLVGPITVLPGGSITVPSGSTLKVI